MGQLLIETIDRPVEVITESTKDGSSAKHVIRGVMLEADSKNKNGRKYPLPVMEKAVGAYNTDKIKTKRAWGQLEHVSDPQIHLERVSHRITLLEMRGSDGYGEAELLDDTPMGRIAIALTKNGVIGTSTRGVGTMQSDGTVDDGYSIAAIDLVADPSASRSLVEAVRESKEWIIGPDGLYIEAPLKNLIKSTDKKFTTASSAAAMQQFISEINAKITLKRIL